MNKQEYLLNQLSQECIEVAKEISKALAFGLIDVYPPDKPYKSNKQRIEEELNDLLGTLDLILKEELLTERTITCQIGRTVKIKKIVKYMKYARKTGALKDE